MDLLPGYRELRPPEALRGVVACFWVRVTSQVGEVRVLPDACTDVVWRRGEGTTIAGPDTSPKLVGRAPGDVTVGMRLLPGAGGRVLGVPLDELRDLRVDVAAVDRAFDLDAEAEPTAVIQRLAAAVREREADPLVAAAARMLHRLDVDAIAREVAMSERQLRRRFHAAVGYGPKTLERILRFRRVVRALDQGRTDFAALAFEAGYADQAHLTRETKRLAGLSPAKLARTLSAPAPRA